MKAPATWAGVSLDIQSEWSAGANGRAPPRARRPTSGGAKPIEVSPAHELMEKGTIIFYGRLTYLDVLKAKRWTGFIYRWHADGTHERLGDRYSKYVEWN
jgi:hypothetical protein